MNIVCVQCHQLDAFFDGELPTDEHESFRAHLTACQRCEEVLAGRINEEIVVDGTTAHLEPDPPSAGTRSIGAPGETVGDSDAE